MGSKRKGRAGRFLVCVLLAAAFSLGPLVQPADAMSWPVALFNAMVPGIVIHGLGHIYAANPAFGWNLFWWELYSLAFMGAGGVISHLELGDWTLMFSSSEMLLGGFLFSLGFSGFVVTWLIDVFFAPLSVTYKTARAGPAPGAIPDRFALIRPREAGWGVDLVRTCF